MREKETIRVQKDQNGVAGERPGAVQRCRLTPVCLSEHGPDSVAVAGDYRLRVVRRTVVDDNDFVKRVILAESAIDRRRQEALVVVVDDDDTNTPRLAHRADLLAWEHIAGSQRAGWHC